jgi:hypothetical protein
MIARSDEVLLADHPGQLAPQVGRGADGHPLDEDTRDGAERVPDDSPSGRRCPRVPDGDVERLVIDR